MLPGRFCMYIYVCRFQVIIITIDLITKYFNQKYYSEQLILFLWQWNRLHTPATVLISLNQVGLAAVSHDRTN